MSALGHYLEEDGIATVAISLIRPQTEKTRPPRALWVPFQLGRPFGSPGEPAFQRRVVLAALRLLERKTGPVIIEDFPDDDPREKADPSWRQPSLPEVLADRTPSGLEARLDAEIPLLAGLHRRWTAEHGRTAVGLSGLPMREIGSYVGEWLQGRDLPSPNDGFSPLLLLRFAADDLKAYCLEAGAAEPGKPSSRQLYDWFLEGNSRGCCAGRVAGHPPCQRQRPGEVDCRQFSGSGWVRAEYRPAHNNRGTVDGSVATRSVTAGGGKPTVSRLSVADPGSCSLRLLRSRCRAPHSSIAGHCRCRAHLRPSPG